MSKKSLQDLRREVSGFTDEIRRELKEHVSEIRENLDRQVTRLRAEVEDVKEELERRFGTDDSHVVFRALPKPRRLNMPLTEVLERRQTRRTFSDEPLSDLDMATILWAADGINRSSGRRTTPTALDWRETDIYLLKSNGIWRWVPEKNGLLFCELADLRSETFSAAPRCTGQSAPRLPWLSLLSAPLPTRARAICNCAPIPRRRRSISIQHRLHTVK